MFKTGMILYVTTSLLLVVHKAIKYLKIRYRLLREKKKHIVDLSSVVYYKEQLDKEKEDWAKLKFWAL